MKLLIKVLQFLSVSEVNALTQLCQAIKILIHDNTHEFRVLVTDKSDVPTRVTKLVNHYKNLEKVLYSHAINNLDVQKVLLNNTNTLRVLTIYNRHFDLDKAFKNIKLPLLTQFSFIDYPREISDVAIAQFTKSCPNLTLINFSAAPS